MKAHVAALVFLGCIGSEALNAQAAPSATLLALSKADKTLAIVDPTTLKVLVRIPAGPDPHEVVASADGRFAYVSNYGSGAYNTLTVIDLVQRKVASTIELGALRGPHGLDVAGGKIWFTAEPAKAIASYDPATKTIDFILGTGQNRTHMILVSEDMKRIITSNVNSATMSIIEKSPGGQPQSDWDETVVPVGRGAEGFDVPPDGREMWVANAQDGNISIVDLSTKKVTATIGSQLNGANRLKFTPDGKRVFVSIGGAQNIVVFDASTRRELKRLESGRGAGGIQMQPDGLRAYAACSQDDNIAVIDLKSLAVIGHIEAIKQPDGLAWAVRR